MANQTFGSDYIYVSNLIKHINIFCSFSYHFFVIFPDRTKYTGTNQYEHKKLRFVPNFLTNYVLMRYAVRIKFIITIII